MYVADVENKGYNLTYFVVSLYFRFNQIMKTLKTAFVLLCLAPFMGLGQNLTVYKSDKSVDETTEKIISVINDHGLIFFETVEHHTIAKERGKELSPTNSILFEDPDLVTRLIACQQTTALDLPLEILVWEEYGDVYIAFVDPKYMKKRFMVLGCDEIIDELTKLMIKVTNDAIRG